jgi:carbohydrate-binding DOMON domain-containing protein
MIEENCASEAISVSSLKEMMKGVHTFSTKFREELYDRFCNSTLVHFACVVNKAKTACPEEALRNMLMNMFKASVRNAGGLESLRNEVTDFTLPQACVTLMSFSSAYNPFSTIPNITITTTTINTSTTATTTAAPTTELLTVSDEATDSSNNYRKGAQNGGSPVKSTHYKVALAAIALVLSRII